MNDGRHAGEEEVCQEDRQRLFAQENYRDHKILICSDREGMDIETLKHPCRTTDFINCYSMMMDQKKMLNFADDAMLLTDPYKMPIICWMIIFRDVKHAVCNVLKS